MPTQQKMLGQLRPANTTAASVYTPPAKASAIIDTIIITNTTGNTPTYRLFLDNDGTTYDQTTALEYDIPMAANESIALTDRNFYMDNSAGNLAVRTSAASEITFTVFGKEITQ